MIRVVIVDDHALVRKGVRQTLEDQGDIVVAAEAGTEDEALAVVRATPCDVVLLDLAMSGRGGLEVLKQLRQELPNIAVLILTMHPEEQYAVRTLRAGAAGYLTKRSAPEDLVRAVRLVAEGKRYITPEVAEHLVIDVVDGGRPPEASLSSREHQIFLLIASGMTISAIATDLALSVKTVSTYRARILEKMGLQTNAELARHAFRAGLVV